MYSAWRPWENLSTNTYRNTNYSNRVIIKWDLARTGDIVLTLDAVYRVYRGNGIEATPDEIFTITPLPLSRQKKNNSCFTLVDQHVWIFIIFHITSNGENIGRKPFLHAWKDYFAHLEKKEKFRFFLNMWGLTELTYLWRKQRIMHTIHHLYSLY